jgi:hypothetical protein
MGTIARWAASLLLGMGAAAGAHAAPCIAQQLDAYLALGSAGCEVGALRFSEFSAVDVLGPASPVDPATVALTPVAGPLGSGFALSFAAGPSAGLAAGPGEFSSLRVGFNVRASGLNAAYGALTGPTASGDGVATLLEDFCLGTAFADPANLACATAAGPTLVAIATELFTDPAMTLALPPVDFLGVVADIGVDGGLTGTSAIAGAELRFLAAGAVPTPPMMLLLLFGLLMWPLLRASPARELR